jgi:hypothetical protein
MTTLTTTRTENREATPEERIETPPARERKERPDVKSFSKAELTPKPLVPFEAPPASTAPPLRW